MIWSLVGKQQPWICGEERDIVKSSVISQTGRVILSKTSIDTCDQRSKTYAILYSIRYR